MKNITSEKETTDKIEIVKQTSLEKKTVFLGTVKPKKGHTMFEFNHVEKTIVPAQFEKIKDMVKWEDAVKGQISVNRQITKKPNCIYVSALNAKNALKILKRELDIEVE